MFSVAVLAGNRCCWSADAAAAGDAASIGAESVFGFNTSRGVSAADGGVEVGSACFTASLGSSFSAMGSAMGSAGSVSITPRSTAVVTGSHSSAYSMALC